MKLALTALFVCLAVCMTGGSAAAQYLKNPDLKNPGPGNRMVCAERSDILRKLANNFDEAQIAMGLGDGGRVIEVFVSPSGSFTVLLSFPTGHSCIAATGEGWRSTETRASRETP